MSSDIGCCAGGIFYWYIGIWRWHCPDGPFLVWPSEIAWYIM